MGSLPWATDTWFVPSHHARPSARGYRQGPEAVGFIRGPSARVSPGAVRPPVPSRLQRISRAMTHRRQASDPPCQSGGGGAHPNHARAAARSRIESSTNRRWCGAARDLGGALARGDLVGSRPLVWRTVERSRSAFAGRPVQPGRHLVVYIPAANVGRELDFHWRQPTDMPMQRQYEVNAARAGLHHPGDRPTPRPVHHRPHMAATHSRNTAHLFARSLQQGWIASVT